MVKNESWERKTDEKMREKQGSAALRCAAAGATLDHPTSTTLSNTKTFNYSHFKCKSLIRYKIILDRRLRISNVFYHIKMDYKPTKQLKINVSVGS